MTADHSLRYARSRLRQAGNRLAHAERWVAAASKRLVEARAEHEAAGQLVEELEAQQ